jgi:pilus assembly protein Flp/PilA
MGLSEVARLPKGCERVVHPHGGRFADRPPVVRCRFFPSQSRVSEEARSGSGTAPFAAAGVREQRKGRFVMSQWLASVRRFLRDEDGPTAVEYAVMLALIIVVCITAITTLGTNASATFSNVALNTAAAGKSS